MNPYVFGMNPWSAPECWLDRWPTQLRQQGAAEVIFDTIPTIAM
jgi:hypothetical protein